jgi:hypothetical protein
MPADRDDEGARRSVVPQAAGRSLWPAAVWTGAGAALVGMIVAIAAVAVCWLPASGGAGNANSALHAGVLTFLAALHGGITVAGLDAGFVPLGLTIAVGIIAWRAGAGLADAANELDETDPGRLIAAAALQTATFVLVCVVAAAWSPLGTSSVSVVDAFVAAAALFIVTGGVAFGWSTTLADDVTERVGSVLFPALRIAAATVAVYLAAGALLVAGSVVVHHAQVEALSRQVGGGWAGLPVLLLGLLAAPNAVIAGAAYLAGPGFAVGSGTTVALGSSPRGTLPAFPILGALPSGPATWLVWLLAVLTPIVAGGVAASIAQRAATWAERWRDAASGVAAAGFLGLVLTWQGGGAIGSGRLHAVGASPWQFGLVVVGGSGIIAAAALGLGAAFESVRTQRAEDRGRFGSLAGLTENAVGAVLAVADRIAEGRGDETKDDQLAG